MLTHFREAKKHIPTYSFNLVPERDLFYLPSSCLLSKQFAGVSADDKNVSLKLHYKPRSQLYFAFLQTCMASKPRAALNKVDFVPKNVFCAPQATRDF